MDERGAVRDLLRGAPSERGATRELLALFLLGNFFDHSLGKTIQVGLGSGSERDRASADHGLFGVRIQELARLRQELALQRSFDAQSSTEHLHCEQRHFLLGALYAGVGVGAFSAIVSVLWDPSYEPLALFLAIIVALVLRPQGLFQRQVVA